MRATRNNNIDAYKVITEQGEHIVTVERIKNDINGNGRYKCTIIFLASGTDNFYTATYTTQGGGCANNRQVAEFVVSEYEKYRAN